MKKVFKVIVFFLILIICFRIVYNITKKKYAYTKMQDFFEQEEDFDVLFFGSSHTMCGIFPMELWKDYGMVSYNLGIASEDIRLSYCNMLLALEETNPKLVVLDTYCVSKKELHEKDKKSVAHKGLDAYPISYKKYLVIKELFGERNILENSFEYLFNFSIYHDRWDELEQEDFINEMISHKGAELLWNVKEPMKMNDFDLVSIDILNYAEDIEENYNIEYLRKFVEHCNENDIEVLLVYLPHPADDRQIAMSKYCKKISNEYNVNYINFLGMDVVNYNTDCEDSKSHLNVSGARKVTSYIGKYIMENYNIPNRKEDERYSFWNEDYNEYIIHKLYGLNANSKNLNRYLMLLYGEEDIKYEIKIANKEVIEKNSTLSYLLENLGNNYEIDSEAFKDKRHKKIKITLKDQYGEIIDTVWWED